MFCLIIKGEQDWTVLNVSGELSIELSGTIPSFKLFETKHRYTHNRLCPATALISQSSLAFLDINPISEGHTQVIPKCKYILTLKYLDPG